MYDLMFAAALSGMRAGEAVNQSQSEPIDFSRTTTVYDRRPIQRDWRELVHEDFSAEVKDECSIFFEKELSGFGTPEGDLSLRRGGGLSMPNYTSRKASAGLASGFLSVTALFFLLTALGIGPPETVSNKAPHTQIRTGR